MLIDAHAHYERPEELEARRGVRTVFCGTNPETAAQCLALEGDNLLFSFGLHPWYADRCAPKDMLPFIRRGAALGEIGLDSVWTDVDLDRQRAAFREQLDLAQALGLPVILHTKGMEAEIARTLADYPLRKLVHWYSCMDHLSLYLEQDCFFTVGPDHASNPAVRQVLERAPLDRLLTETDGLEAIAWALGHPASPADIPAVLRGELAAIAAAHGICEAEAERRTEENLNAFLYGQARFFPPPALSEIRCCDTIIPTLPIPTTITTGGNSLERH